MEDNGQFTAYLDTACPSDATSTDNDLSISFYDAEEAETIQEELRRQREEEAVRHYRCCICGTLCAQGEGQLLWHINPAFYQVIQGHDWHQRALGPEYIPVITVAEILRNHCMLVTSTDPRDGSERNWMCVCISCQKWPNYQQQRRPEPVPQATPSRSSNEAQPSGRTNYPSSLDQIPPGPMPRREYRADFDPSASSSTSYGPHHWLDRFTGNATSTSIIRDLMWAQRLEDSRSGPHEGLPEGQAEDDTTQQHSPYSSADVPTPPGNEEDQRSVDENQSVSSYTSTSSNYTLLPSSMARTMSEYRNLPRRD